MGWSQELMVRFQHTAARRRLPEHRVRHHGRLSVSTHSRPKAAATVIYAQTAHNAVSTHSRPKAAADKLQVPIAAENVSTHSRPKAAAFQIQLYEFPCNVSTHSRPKAAAQMGIKQRRKLAFQHTAARRRLRSNSSKVGKVSTLFQHTAARRRLPARLWLR